MAAVARRRVTVDRQGTSAAFDRLFLAEYSRVVAIAHGIVRDSDEAEDVAQEVFCSFLRQHPADAPYGAAWLYRASAHMALNVIRGKRRRTRREQAEALQRGRLDPDRQSALDPQRAAVQSEEQQEIRRALTRLPEKSAAVLALRYSGLSYAEIADALKIGINQVGTLLRRAEDMIRREMHHATPR
ncbi:MAG: RNA polymerase sigma factor RpoE [Chloroflexota bacterium]